jgi:NADPH-dependent 2,4-dienoyl-CoA reductase/sulfur reductase-like enzyme
VSEERQVDVAVVGGGPAGMAAALAAARAGASVVLIDEYAAPGGQIWRRRFDEVGETAPRSLPRAARELCVALERSDVTVLAGTSVWAAPEPGLLLLTDGRVRARAIVLATGAYDRPVAFGGWTLPGVMTAGGAQALAKGQGVAPGGRVLLAGAGPFLLPVAEQLAACGAEVVAVVEATRRRDWLRAGRRMAAYPGRLLEYARYRTRVRNVIWGHVIVRADGSDRVLSATIAAAGPDWAPAGERRTFEVDAVCTAYGFLPSVDLARALGCELRGDAVAHDDDMRTSVANVFVAGEAAGIGGADLALVEGELAGHAAAKSRADLSALRRRRARLTGFADVLSELFDPRPGLLGLAAPDTVLCRCEDVTAGSIDAAVAGGATSMAALKVVTRCGQGPCQGRTCERLVAARLPEPERFSARAPMRPIPLDVLMDSSLTG